MKRTLDKLKLVIVRRERYHKSNIDGSRGGGGVKRLEWENDEIAK